MQMFGEGAEQNTRGACAPSPTELNLRDLMQTPRRQAERLQELVDGQAKA